MDQKVIDAARAAFPPSAAALTLGAIVHTGECHSEPIAAFPLAMANRHGLIAGATGTGKTRTLQLLAEQFSNAGVPVFLADLKGDLSGMAVAGESNAKVEQRAKDTGFAWKAAACPVEFLSLTGSRGAQLRATVSSFGPLLLAKVLGLNETQTSVLTLVFKFCDDQKLPLIDFNDLRAVLQFLVSAPGKPVLEQYGGMTKATVGVLLREMVELEAQGAGAFLGEPEFELEDLLQLEDDGRGVVSVLALQDVQDKPALFSTFMMWMLAGLYHELPEVGDVDKPKLVFFFDEAHLLFDGASKAFLQQVEQVVRLIRSKGVGVFFVTQNPKDVPADILGQLGNRVQHALRAFTPDDERDLRAAARTFPKTAFYEVEEILTTLGIGEAFVTVLTPNGTPTPPFAVRMIPPASRMGPLTDAELRPRLAASEQVREYAIAVDSESAREMLAARMTGDAAGRGGDVREIEADESATSVSQTREREPAAPPTGMLEAAATWAGALFGSKLVRDMARTATREVARGAMGRMVGAPPRRRATRRRTTSGSAAAGRLLKGLFG
ncbi:MAG: helicase HerA-like domain-containing protein [Candidatus Eisenbacteria bacterium]